MKPGRPEDPIVFQPELHLPERFGLQRVNPRLGYRSVTNQAGRPKNPEVLRDRGPANREQRGDVPHRPIPNPKGIEDRSTGRVGDGLEHHMFCPHMVT